MITPIRVPRENANDEFIKIVAVLRPSGTAINKGEAIFEIEGAKAITEIEALVGGYFFPLKEQGEEVEVGAIIGVIADSQEFDVAEFEAKAMAEIGTPPQSTLLNANGMQAANFAHIQTQNGGAVRSHRGAEHSRRDCGRLVAIGAGRGLVQLIEALAGRSNWRLVGCYDDQHWMEGLPRLGLPLLGPVDVDLLAEDFAQNTFDAAIITVSTSIGFRSKIFEKLTALGIEFPTIVHPSVAIHETARIGRGSLIMPYVHIGPFAEIGDNNFISSYCNIEHHCILGDHNTFGPSVVLSGSVVIGSRVKLGTGIFIEPLIAIGSGCNIASGCTITQSIGNEAIVKVKTNIKIGPVTNTSVG